MSLLNTHEIPCHNNSLFKGVFNKKISLTDIVSSHKLTMDQLRSSNRIPDENDVLSFPTLNSICLDILVSLSNEIGKLSIPYDILIYLAERLRKEFRITDENLNVFYPLESLNLEGNMITDRGLTYYADRARHNVSSI